MQCRPEGPESQVCGWEESAVNIWSQELDSCSQRLHWIPSPSQTPPSLEHQDTHRTPSNSRLRSVQSLAAGELCTFSVRLTTIISVACCFPGLVVSWKLSGAKAAFPFQGRGCHDGALARTPHRCSETTDHGWMDQAVSGCTSSPPLEEGLSNAFPNHTAGPIRDTPPNFASRLFSGPSWLQQHSNTTTAWNIVIFPPYNGITIGTC